MKKTQIVENTGQDYHIRIMLMKHQGHLLSFFCKVVNDPRISKAHMAVYMALFYLWSKQQYQGLLSVYSWQIMPIAKISTSGTYYMVIKQLDEYGYLKYLPSFYSKRASQVDLEVMTILNQSQTDERG